MPEKTSKSVERSQNKQAQSERVAHNLEIEYESVNEREIEEEAYDVNDLVKVNYQYYFISILAEQ